jgi:hypothetical protein
MPSAIVERRIIAALTSDVPPARANYRPVPTGAQ